MTRMRFDTKSESPKLFFKTMRWLTEDENEKLDAGYSSYPMGELEDMGYKYLDGEGSSCRFKHSEGKVIEVSPESRIY